jgi:hypothetical protein
MEKPMTHDSQTPSLKIIVFACLVIGFLLLLKKQILETPLASLQSGEVKF